MNNSVFFGLRVDPFSLGGQSLALMLAVLLGGLIGLDREYRGQPAGLRTHVLVCVGAAIITITSVHIGRGVAGTGNGDPGHIAAQIVSGIGFLGAGAILREGLSVRGLTTAASVWATAGIGITIGASPRLGELAVVGTVIVLATLIVFNKLEEALKLKHCIFELSVEVYEADHGPARVMALLAEHHVEVLSVLSEPGKGKPGVHREPMRQLMMRVRLPRGFDRQQLNMLLAEAQGLISFAVE